MAAGIMSVSLLIVHVVYAVNILTYHLNIWYFTSRNINLVSNDLVQAHYQPQIQNVEHVGYCVTVVLAAYASP